MGDRIKMLFVVFLFVPFFLWAENVQLNLPERFDAKIMKGYFHSTNGSNPRSNPISFNKKFYEYDTQPQSCRIVHFKNGKFHLYCKYINKSKKAFPRYESNEYANAYVVLKWKGNYSKDGSIKGYFSYYHNQWEYNDKLTIPSTYSAYKDYEKGTLEGKIEGDKIFIKQYYTQKKYYAPHKEYMDGIYKVTGKWELYHPVITPIKATYDLDIQSDINTQENTQKEPIPNEPDNEPEPIQEQPVTIPKTNITAKAGIPADTQTEESTPQKEQNPCTQKPIDDAWKEYCETKAHNAKMRQEEEAEAKAAEQEAREEEEYQKKLDAWNEEERQSNIKFVQSHKAETQKAREIWKEEDKAFNESIAKDQAERKAKQAEIEKAHKIIDRFGGDYETQRAAHKKVEALAKTADTQKAKKIKNAIRKQFYDSKQITLQAEAEYQTSKAKELGKKEKYLNTVKKTSLTVNKVLARIDSEIDPLKIGNKIVDLQENSYDAINSYSKGGLSKVADDFIEKKANELSNDWAGVAKEKVEEYKQYHSKKGLKLKPNEVYFDKDGKRLKKVNIYQRVYDKKGNEVSFSFGKRIFKKTFSKLNDDYNTVQGTAEHIKNIKEGVMSGDVNKVVNETLDVTQKEDESEEKYSTKEKR